MRRLLALLMASLAGALAISGPVLARNDLVAAGLAADEKKLRVPPELLKLLRLPVS